MYGWALHRTLKTTDEVKSKQAGLTQSGPRRNEDSFCDHIPTRTLLAHSLDNKRPYSRHLVCDPCYRIGIKWRWFRLRRAVLSLLMNLGISTQHAVGRRIERDTIEHLRISHINIATIRQPHPCRNLNRVKPASETRPDLVVCDLVLCPHFQRVAIGTACAVLPLKGSHIASVSSCT